MKKRIFALLLLLCVLFSFGAFSAVAEETEDTEEFKVTETMYKYGLLSKLGITEEKEYAYIELDEKVTRADLAQYAVKISEPNMAEVSFTQNPFSDVDEKTEKGAYITEAYSKGIMNGYTDGTFKPEKEVTLGEFLKTMIILLGAENISEVKGGFYRGYINVAKTKNILPKNASENGAVTLEMAVSVIYDTLMASVTDITSLGNSIKYDETESLLYTNFGIYTTEGVLTSVYGYSVNGISECEKDEIEISRQRYIIGEEDSYVEFFGDNTVGFFRVEPSDKYSLIYLYPKNQNRVTVNGRDVEETDRSTLKLTDGKKSLRMESDAVTLFGGVNYASFANTPESVFTSHNAEITLIDNDNNGRYDIALVFEYKSLQAMFFGKTKKVIYLNEGLLFDGKNEIVLGTEDDNNEVPYYVYDEGEVVSPDTIRKNDILSIAKSQNLYGDPTYTIHISRDKISGTIESVSDDEITFVYSGEEAVKETMYMVSDFRANSKKDYELGIEAEYYVNHKGELAAIAPKKGSDGTTVGYLTSVKILNKTFESKIGFQIVDTNGKITIYEGSDKITVKTTKEKDYVSETVYKEDRYNDLRTDVMDTLMFKNTETGETRDKWHGGLCKYVLNDDGKLTELMISCDLSAKAGYAGSDRNNFSLDFYYNNPSDGIGLRCLRGWLTPKIRLNSAKVFYVPDEIINDNVDEDDYIVGGMSIIGGVSDKYYNNIKIYDVGDSELAMGSYVVKEYAASSGVEKITSIGSADNNIIAVTGLTTVYDENKGQVYKLTGRRNGGEYSCMIPVDDELPKESNYPGDIYTRGLKFTDIQKGDIIQCSYDAGNKIDAFRIVYRKSVDEGNFFGKGGYTDNGSSTWFNKVPENKKDMSILTLYGKVAYYDTTSKIAAIDCRGFEKEEGYSDEYYYVYCNFGHVAKITLMENDKASNFSADRIEVGDTVFVYGFWNDTADVVVMR